MTQHYLLYIIYTSFYVFDPHKRNTYGLPDSNGGAIVLKFNCFKQLCLYIYELSKSLSSTHYELTPVIITKYKQIRSDQKANTSTSPEMKIVVISVKRASVKLDVKMTYFLE